MQPKITRQSETRWRVASQTRKGISYLVMVESDGLLHCSCLAGMHEQECWHVREVAQIIRDERGCSTSVTAMPTEPEQNPNIARTMAELVSPRQLVEMRGIARDKGLYARWEDLCEVEMGCKAEEMSRKAASAFIDYLKGYGEEKAPEYKSRKVYREGFQTIIAEQKQAPARYEGRWDI